MENYRIRENKNLKDTAGVAEKIRATQLFDRGLERIIGEYAGPPPAPRLKPQPFIPTPSFWSKIWDVLRNAWNAVMNFFKQFTFKKTPSKNTVHNESATSAPDKTITTIQPISSLKTGQVTAHNETTPTQTPSENPKKFNR